MDNLSIPIGTVVEIKNSDLRVIIVGYGGIDGDTNEKFDYISFPYPRGFINRKYTLLFNKDKIGKILFEGYKDSSYKKMLEVASKK